ncbi:uncharacterized protein LOC135097974 [Scylla paramamosain]|uniref:uncharacterized protein LOC135097974 n=1 Tax=Scylla paramamosain TaxID=85552 RepID=UPI003082C94F
MRGRRERASGPQFLYPYNQGYTYSNGPSTPIHSHPLIRPPAQSKGYTWPETTVLKGLRIRTTDLRRNLENPSMWPLKMVMVREQSISEYKPLCHTCITTHPILQQQQQQQQQQQTAKCCTTHQEDEDCSHIREAGCDF